MILSRNWMKDLPHEGGRANWIGAAIGAGAAILGNMMSSSSNKSSTDRQIAANAENMEKYNTHALLDKYSGGDYSKYLGTYAFGSPTQQGEWARDMQSSMYPELTAYELAGSSSSGVAGAVGDNASSKAMQGAQLESQQRIAQSQQETALKTAQIQGQTQLAVAGVNAASSNYIADRQMTQQQPKVDAEVSNIWSKTDLNQSQKQLQVAQIIETEARTANINMDTKVKDKVVAFTEANTRFTNERTHNERYASSQAGKTVKDAANVVTDAASSASTALKGLVSDLVGSGNTQDAAEAFVSKVTGWFKQGSDWIKGQFNSAMQPPPPGPDPRAGVGASSHPVSATAAGRY